MKLKERRNLRVREIDRYEFTSAHLPKMTTMRGQKIVYIGHQCVPSGPN